VVNGFERAADEAVDRFVRAVAEIQAQFFDDYPALDGVVGLMGAVRSTRTMAREGRSPGGIDYSVHGAGCRMTDPRGRQVDVDIDVDGLEIFDAWRVHAFLDDRHDGALSVKDLLAACQRMASRGSLRHAQHDEQWFERSDH